MVYCLYSHPSWIFHVCVIFVLILLDGMAVVLIADLVLSLFMMFSRYSVIFLVLLIADLIIVLLGI